MSHMERHRFCGALAEPVFNPGHIPLPTLLRPTDPDATILRCCQAFHQLTREAETINADLCWDRHQAVISRRTDIATEISGMEPRSDAGRRAQASVALQLLTERGPAMCFRDVFVERLLARIAVGGV